MEGASHLLSPAPYSWPLLGLAISLEEVRGNTIKETRVKSPGSPSTFFLLQGSLPFCCAAARMEFHLLSHSMRRMIRVLGCEHLRLGRRGEKRAGERTREKLMSHFSDSMDMQAIVLLL